MSRHAPILLWLETTTTGCRWQCACGVIVTEDYDAMPHLVIAQHGTGEARRAFPKEDLDAWLHGYEAGSSACHPIIAWVHEVHQHEVAASAPFTPGEGGSG